MSIAPIPLDPAAMKILADTTTATITTILLKKGLRARSGAHGRLDHG